MSAADQDGVAEGASSCSSAWWTDGTAIYRQRLVACSALGWDRNWTVGWRDPGVPPGAGQLPLGVRDEREHVGGGVSGRAPLDGTTGEDPGVGQLFQRGSRRRERHGQAPLRRPG